MIDSEAVKVGKRRSSQQIRRLVREFEASGLRQVGVLQEPRFGAQHIAATSAREAVSTASQSRVMWESLSLAVDPIFRSAAYAFGPRVMTKGKSAICSGYLAQLSICAFLMAHSAQEAEQFTL
jgi:hypothetical protein